MQPQTLKFIALTLPLAALAGCQSGSLTHYVSPQVTGRVLAADTREPLAKVDVRRTGSNQNVAPLGPVKGGQLMMRSSGTRTDNEGRFVLDSKSVIAIFQQPGWSSVPLTFSRSGYHSLQTNYTSLDVTSHTSAGAPVVDIGDALLQPVGR